VSTCLWKLAEWADSLGSYYIQDVFVYVSLLALCSYRIWVLPYLGVVVIFLTVTLSTNLQSWVFLASLRTHNDLSLTYRRNLLPFLGSVYFYIQFWTLHYNRSRISLTCCGLLFSLMIFFPATNIVIQLLLLGFASFIASMCGCLLSNFCRTYMFTSSTTKRSESL